MSSRRTFLLTAPLLGGATWLSGQDWPPPYVPTPMPIVKAMLELGGLKRGEKMFDLGSGDGRIVILAAKEFGADAIGVEYNHELVLESRRKIQRAGVGKRVRIVEGDLFVQDYSSADLLTVYLLPSANERLQPLLARQLRKSARVVAHDFLIRGWEPARTVDIEDDGTGRSRTLYLYRP
ncbi:MAG: class I SAM-dependent methyltransferase [Acidobacteria bacterium]|nr:class I SAM-dependent methyltransferase [Acidobacteriota bacterium]